VPSFLQTVIIDIQYSQLHFIFFIIWTGEEEITLLDVMSDCGYGNWSDVAARIRTKSQAECQNHYINCYVDQPHADLPEFTKYERDVHPQPIMYKLCDDPPRYPENNELSGYMAGRGDFHGREQSHENSQFFHDILDSIIVSSI
jgi:hypothetical protein